MVNRVRKTERINENSSFGIDNEALPRDTDPRSHLNHGKQASANRIFGHAPLELTSRGLQMRAMDG